MALISTEDAKAYLRVDSADEDATVGILLASAIRETMKVAILYSCAYFFEHREDADHHALTLTLRSLLFAIREGAFS